MGRCGLPGCDEWINAATDVYCCELHRIYHKLDIEKTKSEQLQSRLSTAEAERDADIKEIGRIGRELGTCQHERDRLKAENERLDKRRIELCKKVADYGSDNKRLRESIKYCLDLCLCTEVGAKKLDKSLNGDKAALREVEDGKDTI